jgi:glutathione S-transferase
MLELYQFEGCPYCKKVRKKMTELGLSFIAHNPRQNEEKMEELMERGGQDQVPFLVDRAEDGSIRESLYESDDIVEYLEKHYA